MNGKKARLLRKQASQLANKESGGYLVQTFKKLLNKTDSEGKQAEMINETIRWKPDSFMGIYRKLKKQYKEGRQI